ncbi:hypothetical protein AAK967_02935 [Atopobiaceae bacterium 24-176]
MSKTVTLKGDVPSAPCIVNAAPLLSLAADEPFEMEAGKLSGDERKAVAAAGPFAERTAAYGLWYGSAFVGAATGLAHAVRSLLELGDTVRVAAARTEDKLGGYSGVELELPEADPFERWHRFVAWGIDIPLDDPIVVANLSIEPGAATLADGPASVTVGEPQGDALPVTVSGTGENGRAASASWRIVARQHHSHTVLAPLAGRTCRAVVERRDSFTHRGTHYMKVFIDTVR